jgi:hypothetical protein
LTANSLQRIVGSTTAPQQQSQMPIARLLAQSSFTQEQRSVLEQAFHHVLRKLHLVDRNDPICEIVARKVIEIGASGATNAAAIAETAFKQLNPDHPA